MKSGRPTSKKNMTTTRRWLRILLAEVGYPHGFKTNIVADTTGDMVLLDIVKQYFADIGIDMEIRPMIPQSGLNMSDRTQARPAGAAHGFPLRPPFRAAPATSPTCVRFLIELSDGQRRCSDASSRKPSPPTMKMKSRESCGRQ